MRTVTVTGTGSTTVAPDSAVVRVAAVARGAGVAEAYDAMSAAAATLVDVAGRHTERRRVASTGISVWPWHDRDGQRQGYEARHSYAIGCPDLPVAGALLAELARAVGDGLAVDSVGLEVTEDRGAGAAAREAAFADARQRAAALAQLAGARLGQVRSIVEGDASSGPGPMPRMAMVRDAGGGIEPGEATVTSAVTVVWELEAEPSGGPADDLGDERGAEAGEG
jgi:uncharacterized protein YggE